MSSWTSSDEEVGGSRRSNGLGQDNERLSLHERQEMDHRTKWGGVRRQWKEANLRRQSASSVQKRKSMHAGLVTDPDMMADSDDENTLSAVPGKHSLH